MGKYEYLGYNSDNSPAVKRGFYEKGGVYEICETGKGVIANLICKEVFSKLGPCLQIEKTNGTVIVAHNNNAMLCGELTFRNFVNDHFSLSKGYRWVRRVKNVVK